MNLDILRNEWAARDEKLDAALRLNARLLKAGLVDRQRGAMRRLLPFGLFDQLGWVVTGVLLILFIGRHGGDLRFLLPAAALLAWTIATGVAAARQRLAMESLDYGETPVALQKKLAALKVQRLTALKWSFLTGQLLWWVPFLTVLFKGVLGVDLYSVNAFMWTFFLANLAVGLAFIPLASLAAKAISGRFEGAPWFQRLTDALVGEDLVKARAFVDELARFERE